MKQIKMKRIETKQRAKKNKEKKNTKICAHQDIAVFLFRVYRFWSILTAFALPLLSLKNYFFEFFVFFLFVLRRDEFTFEKIIIAK